MQSILLVASMSNLPTTLWGAINRAKIDIRKYHLEKNPKKKAVLREKALAAMANADAVVGPGPHRFISSRSKWRNEVLFLNNYEEDPKLGRYWQDDKEQWSIENVPEWAADQSLKVQEPKVGCVIVVQGRGRTYEQRPPHQDR
jgi:hypothetical protein